MSKNRATKVKKRELKKKVSTSKKRNINLEYDKAMEDAAKSEITTMVKQLKEMILSLYKPVLYMEKSTLQCIKQIEQKNIFSRTVEVDTALARMNKELANIREYKATVIKDLCSKYVAISRSTSEMDTMEMLMDMQSMIADADTKNSELVRGINETAKELGLMHSETDVSSDETIRDEVAIEATELEEELTV